MTPTHAVKRSKRYRYYVSTALIPGSRSEHPNGDLAGARPLLERALAIREKAPGPDHPDTATVRNHLANLLSQRG
jgi:hypothetical protein